MGERRVGKMGESTLYQWCAQVGITANKAIDDEQGWDYILEFPLGNSTTNIQIPLDRMPFPIKCLIQVKSTDGTDGKWSIKLSNWVHLINSPLPTFFLVFEFDGADSCQRAFLVHIDKIYIEKVMKRLRESSLDESFKLNEHELQFKWNEENAIVTLSGQGLENSIHTYIPDGMEAYATEKLKIIDEIGYEEVKQKFHFKIPKTFDMSIEEYLVDFAIGLVPRLPVVDGEVRDYRFGIAAPTPDIVFQNGYIEIDVEKSAVCTGEITLSTIDEIKELRLTPAIYTPYGLGIPISEEYQKIRLACPFIDFILYRCKGKGGRVTLHYPDSEEIISLENLIPISKLTLLINEAIVNHQERVKFEFRIDIDLVSAGQFSFNSLPSEYIEMATVINYAWTVAKHFEIQDQVKLGVLELLYQQRRLMFMASILGTQRGNMRIVFYSQEQPPDNKKMCLPYVVDALIGEYRVVIAVAVIGEPRPTGEIDIENGLQYEIVTQDTRLHRSHYYNREIAPTYSLEALRESIINTYEESAQILILDS